MPTLSIADVQILEGDSGLKLITFEVTLDEAATTNVTYDITLTADTADGNDFQGGFPRTVSFTMPAGETQGLHGFNVVGDTDFEPDETFFATLSNVAGADIGDGQAIATILNDDAAPALPQISVSDQSITEGTIGNGGTTLVPIAITLDQPATQAVTFTLTVSAGTAGSSDIPGVLPQTFTRTISAGESSYNQNITINADFFFEQDETLALTLSEVAGAEIGTGSAELTIVNDDIRDDLPTASIGDASVLEGDSGVTYLEFPITLSAAHNNAVFFDVRLDAGTADGAPGSGDFVGDGSLYFATINAGETSGVLTAQILGDTDFEPDETFTATLQKAADGFLYEMPLGQSVATGTIENDDVAPTPVASLGQIQNPIDEGTGANTTLTIPVELSVASSSEVTVELEIRGINADTTSDDVQGTLPRTETVTFAPGEVSASVDVVIVGDALPEPEQAIALLLKNPVGADLGAFDRTVVTVTDDDVAGTGSISGRVFLDADGDGIQDPGEGGVSGVSLGLSTLTDFLGIATTDGNGDYEFTSLVADDYVVSLDNTDPSLAISPKDVGGDDSVDSDFSPVLIDAGSSDIITVGDGQTVTNLDGGLTEIFGSIAGRAFVDLNGNNLDDGEPGVENVMIHLLDEDGNVVATSNSASDGSYAFFDLVPGDYTLEAQPLPDQRPLVAQDVGGDDTIDSDFDPNSFATSVTVGAGEDVTDVEVGFQAPDTLPVISVGSTASFEGDSGTSDSSMFVFLDTAVDYEVTFELAFASAAVDGIGPDDIDPDLNGEKLTGSFAPGETVAQVPVLGIKGDTVVEADEVYDVTLQNVVGATLGESTTTFEIRNDDVAAEPPGLSIADATVVESDTGFTTIRFTVTLDAPAATDVTFDYEAFVGGGDTATTADFELTDESATIPAGVTEISVSTRIINDLLVEPDETFTMEISNVVGATVIDGAATGTIIDNDAATDLPTAQILGSVAPEGDFDITPFDFEIRLTEASATDVTGELVVTPGLSPAADDADIAGAFPVVLSFTIPAGETSAIVTLPVLGDTVIEPDEYLEATLQNMSGAVWNNSPNISVIIDDDAPEFAVPFADSPLQLREGDVGSRIFEFVVERNGNTDGPASLDWEVVGSGANPANAADFGGVLPSGTVDFADGESQKSVLVEVSGDVDVEPDEDFTVAFSNPVGATLLSQYEEADATIINDDNAYAIAPLDAVKPEGDSGPTAFTFLITREVGASTPVEVSWAVNGAGGDPANAADFNGAFPNGSVVLDPDELQKQITVNVSGDLDIEADETFVVNITDIEPLRDHEGDGPPPPELEQVILLSQAPTPQALAIVDNGPGAEGTILNDDGVQALPNIFIDEVNQAEGDSGPTDFTFTVSLDGPATVPVSFTAELGFDSGGAGVDANAADFVSAAPVNGSIGVGQTSTTVTFQVQGDLYVEADEIFSVGLSNIVGAEPGNTAGANLILNDDGDLPAVSISDATVAEGDSGATDITFTVSLDKTATGFVDFIVALDLNTQGIGDDAEADDFVSSIGQSASIAPGESSTTVTFQIQGDTDIEPDEVFLANLFRVSGATVADGTGIGTILNDDFEQEPPQIDVSINSENADKHEGDHGTTPFSFSVTRQGDLGESSSVDWEVSYGDTDQSDFEGSVSGTVHFGPGENHKTVTIDVAGDTDEELDEAFHVVLSNPVNAGIDNGHASGVIRNDDQDAHQNGEPHVPHEGSGDGEHEGDGENGDENAGNGGGHDCIEHFPNPTKVGSNNGETLRGGLGYDAIDARGGADTVFGGDGDDYVRGGSGEDTLKGNGGNDKLYGEEGDDFLKGGTDDDRLDGGADNDRLQGGAGTDAYVFGRGYGTDRVLDFRSGESIIFSGAGLPGATALLAMFVDAAEGATLTLDDGSTLILNGVGKNSLSTDQFQFETCAAGGGHANGENGEHSNGENGEHSNGENGEHSNGENEEHSNGENEEHSNGENAEHSNGENAEHSNGENAEHSNGENAEHSNGENAEHSNGENEEHSNGENEEHSNGENGEHSNGENGEHSNGGDANGDQAPSSPTRVGSDQGETLRGGSSDDVIDAKGGADTVFGADGDDWIYGGEGGDTLKGNGGDDHVFGGAGADLVKGDAGDDRLDGGADADTLIGGAGTDAFVFKDGYGQDTIADLRSFETVDIETAAFASVEDLVDAFENGPGGAVLDLGNGDVLTLAGWSADDLKAEQFDLL